MPAGFSKRPLRTFFTDFLMVILASSLPTGVVAVSFSTTKIVECSIYLTGRCIFLMRVLVSLLYECMGILLPKCVAAVSFSTTKIVECTIYLIERYVICPFIALLPLFAVGLLLYSIYWLVILPGTTRMSQKLLSSQPRNQSHRRSRSCRPRNPPQSLRPRSNPTNPTFRTNVTSLMTDSNSTITCIVCFRDSDETLISGNRFSSECKHESHLCIECAQRYVHELIQRGQVQNIRCVEEGCSSTLSSADVKRVVTQEDFARYQRMLPKFRWCSNPTCNPGQIHEDGERRPILICRVCGAKTCFRHRARWHSRRTCSQYDKDMNRGGSWFNSEARMIWMLERKGLIKKCPQCGQGIQKNGGCDHMICSKTARGCGAEFCWLCLADYNGPNGIRNVGNTAHLKTCKHYA